MKHRLYRRCETCRFCGVEEETCQYNAPLPSIMEVGKVASDKDEIIVWPRVNLTSDWCGRWKISEQMLRENSGVFGRFFLSIKRIIWCCIFTSIE